MGLYDLVVREAFGGEVADALQRIVSSDSGTIFVARAGERFLIHFTSGDPNEVIRDLSKLSPTPVELVGQRPGTWDQKQALVARYIHRRDHRAWMQLEPEEVKRVLTATLDDEDPKTLAREWLRLVPKTREKEAVTLVLRSFPLSVSEVQELVREWRSKNGQNKGK